MRLSDIDAAEAFMREQRICDPFAFAFCRPAARRVKIDALAEPGDYPRQIGFIRTGVRARLGTRPASEIPAAR